MDRGAWQAPVHQVAKSWIQLKDFHFHTILKQAYLGISSKHNCKIVCPNFITPQNLGCHNLTPCLSLDFTFPLVHILSFVYSHFSDCIILLGVGFNFLEDRDQFFVSMWPQDLEQSEQPVNAYSMEINSSIVLIIS